MNKEKIEDIINRKITYMSFLEKFNLGWHLVKKVPTGMKQSLAKENEKKEESHKKEFFIFESLFLMNLHNKLQ